MTAANPLLLKSTHRDEAIPFGQIKTEHFLPALKKSIEDAKKNIAAIKLNKVEPNFENTIEALEYSSETLEHVSSIYFNLFSAEANEELQALSKEISPLLAEFQSDVILDSELFEKIKKVYEHRGSLHLANEKLKLLTKTYKDFVRNGSLLSTSDKEKLRKIDLELSNLGPLFQENILKATNKFELWITDKSDLDGLPEGFIESLAIAASEKGQEGKWLVTLHYPSFAPFMQFSTKAYLREKLYRAYNSRCFGDEFDNQETVMKMVQLRHDRAHLLGFANHADFVLQERMAQTQEQVINFLNRLLNASKVTALSEVNDLRKLKKEIYPNEEIYPWDSAYYSEKLKTLNYNFNSEELRPYFKLENVAQGAFEHARLLYGLTFKKINDVEVFHPDVQAYEVHDGETDEYIGLFYTDFFPRETKKGGAWATEFRGQGHYSGESRRPHVMIVCNFTKPTSTKPSLLTFDEVKTLFHEFGHALHMLLSKCHYRSLAGANVYWDFVELPSQIMENWIEEKESLDLFARHYETNEIMPADLIQKLKKSSRFQAGLMTVRQLSFGLLDLAWYTTNPANIKSVAELENKALEATRLLPPVERVNVSCSFSHIFAGGYSAGYYSYKWAEVLDADAFEYFKEKGLFNRDVAKLFREHILSKGASEHPMELYKKFRGREPDANALLRRDGLV